MLPKVIQKGLSSRTITHLIHTGQSSFRRCSYPGKRALHVLFHQSQEGAVVPALQYWGWLGSALPEALLSNCFVCSTSCWDSVYLVRAVPSGHPTRGQLGSRLQEGWIDLEMVSAMSPCLAAIFMSPSSLFPFASALGRQICWMNVSFIPALSLKKATSLPYRVRMLRLPCTYLGKFPESKSKLSPWAGCE